jgi:hypothetical protein
MVTNMISYFVLSKIIIRTFGTWLGTSDVLPPKPFPTVRPLESAPPKNVPVTLLESALAKKGWGRG